MEPRDPERIPEVLQQLGQIWKRHPELRLTQLILNYLDPEIRCPELYSLEDDELLRRLGVDDPPPVRRQVVDLSSVSSEAEIHEVFASTFHFPSFYGANWDAFWDILTGFDCLPKRITITGRNHLQDTFPEALEKLDACFIDHAKEDGDQATDVAWR